MLGGVVRNIVECFLKFGIKLYMISVVGNDMVGVLFFCLMK